MMTIQTANAMQEIMFENLDAKQLPVIARGKQREQHPEGLAIRYRRHNNTHVWCSSAQSLLISIYNLSLAFISITNNPSLYHVEQREEI